MDTEKEKQEESKHRFFWAAGAAVGLALLLMDRIANRPKELIVIEQEMPVPALQVLDIIKQVELEKELIPVISSVEVHERTERNVRYTVKASGGLPAAVQYSKCWDESLPAAYWQSEKGTAGFHHEGSIHFTERDGISVAYLVSEHWVTAPILGRITAPMLTPVIRAELEVWLKHIAEKLGQKGD